jgi:DNA-binding NarL/FixJ family response regulator
MPNLAAPALPVSAEQRTELAKLAKSTMQPSRLSVQARALSMAADGVANEEIARSCGVTSDTVRRWRSRFAQSGVAGIGLVAKGRGRRTSLSAATIAEVLRLTLHERPRHGAMVWSTRTMAAQVGIGKDAVARIWAQHDLHPQRSRLREERGRGDGPERGRDAALLQYALLRGDVLGIHRLVDAELADQSEPSPRRAWLLAGRSFASILESRFAAAHDDASAGLRMGVEQRLFQALRALSSAMGGLERDGSDIVSVEGMADAVLRLSAHELLTESWTAALTAEAAMSVGRLDLAENVARRVWLASVGTDPPEAIFAGQALVRALLFQGRLEEASALGPEVDAGARRHGLDALRLVVRGSLAYVDALCGRFDELTRHADTIGELASQCPAGYFVAGGMVLTAYALATAQRAQHAADVLLHGAGGPLLPNIQLVDRAYGYELLVTAALSLGDVAAARQWQDFASSLTGLPPSGMAAAALGRINARVAVAEGKASAGAALAERAAAIAAGNAGYLDATRAQLLAGTALLFDADDNWPARLALSTASEQALLLGATSLAVLARRDLRSVGLRLIGEPQEPMSPREREVAELLLAGASDVQISATLGVSRRTVQSHVRRVLKALDLPSRTAVPRALRNDRDRVAPSQQLTPRQYQVAELVTRGYTNDGAARALNVSIKTIEKHLGDAYRRLGIDSRAALAARWSS